jgi:hypothetical protein
MVIISNLKTFHLQHDMRVKLFSLPFLLQSITPIEHLTMSFTTKLNSLFSRRWRRRKLRKKGDDSKASQTKQYRYLLLARGKEMEELLRF